ncbi:phytochelatin synthase family protein [Coxiella burnetii]|uniref:phytochelatin synthase family protein n=3 Tax=Coxiella burnetii TaxID=777 RepID=UPI0012BD1EA9
MLLAFASSANLRVLTNALVMNISLAKKFAFFIVTLILSMKVCALPTLLPVPHNLIAFNSPAGIKLFNKSQHKTAFWELIPYFTTEKGVAFCGVAASVMVLNAVNIKPDNSLSLTFLHL